MDLQSLPNPMEMDWVKGTKPYGIRSSMKKYFLDLGRSVEISRLVQIGERRRHKQGKYFWPVRGKLKICRQYILGAHLSFETENILMRRYTGNAKCAVIT